jgi:hypothetical protein
MGRSKLKEEDYIRKWGKKIRMKRERKKRGKKKKENVMGRS